MANMNIAIEIAARDNASGVIGSVQRSLGGLGKAAGAGLAGLQNVAMLAGGAAVAGIGALGVALVGSTQAAMEAQSGQAELAAVLASTNGAAGMTAEAINGLASKFQAITPFEDDVVLAGENMLLTFTNIGKDVFPQATEAMLNMGQKFGSVDAAAMQLGKALNDPVAGVTALRRVGVALTEAQEESIKAFMAQGDIASAQKIILGELETEFGGLAIAAGDTLAGKMTILQNTFGDMQETIGAALIPAVTSVADMFLDGLNSEQGRAALANVTQAVTDLATWFTTVGLPAIQEFATTAQLKIGEMVTAIKPYLAEAWLKFNELSTWFTMTGGPAIQQFAASAGQWIQEFVERAKPIIDEFSKKWDERAKPALDQVRSAIGRIGAVLSETLAPIMGDSMKNFDAMDALLAGLEGTLNLVVLAVEGIGKAFEGIAWVFERVGEAVKIFKDLKNQIQQIADILSSGDFNVVGGLSGLGSALNLPGFADGGVVPGAIGAPMLAIVHGGETITPPGNQTGAVFNITINANDGAGGQRAGAGFVRALRAQGVTL